MQPSEAVTHLSKYRQGAILTIGAGDIDRIVEPLRKSLV
jgi:hypothetical protein